MFPTFQTLRTTMGRVLSALVLTIATGVGAHAQVVNNPPVAPISLTAFPHRSFVSMAAGPHQMVWDGRSSAGSQSAPGVYFAVLRFENTTLTKRIVRVP